MRWRGGVYAVFLATAVMALSAAVPGGLAHAGSRVPGNDSVIGATQSTPGEPGLLKPDSQPDAQGQGEAPDFVERHCTVTSVHDGDSMRVRCPGFRDTLRIRLHQIDAPELDQVHGTRSREFLRSICPVGATAIVRDYGADDYNRRLGRVICDGIDANAAMVESGAAWVYTYHATDPQLYQLQEQAQTLRRGLWATSSGKKPLAPWDFRYQQRKNEQRQRQ